MTNTTNPALRLPVANGNRAMCCKNVKFVRVQLSVNVINHVTIDNPGPTTLWIEYYIKLPQSLHQWPMRKGMPTTSRCLMVLGTYILFP